LKWNDDGYKVEEIHIEKKDSLKIRHLPLAFYDKELFWGFPDYKVPLLIKLCMADSEDRRV